VPTRNCFRWLNNKIRNSQDLYNIQPPLLLEGLAEWTNSISNDIDPRSLPVPHERGHHRGQDHRPATRTSEQDNGGDAIRKRTSRLLKNQYYSMYRIWTDRCLQCTTFSSIRLASTNPSIPAAPVGGHPIATVRCPFSWTPTRSLVAPKFRSVRPWVSCLLLLKRRPAGAIGRTS